MVPYKIFWQTITYFGDIQYWLGITVAALIIYQLISKKNKQKVAWIILALLPSIIISSLIVDLLKNLFKIPRSCVGLVGCPISYSFPSGHAAVVFAFATIILLFTRKKVLSSLIILLAILVALSRVFLNYHTVLDITGGSIVGIIISYLFYLSYKPVHSFLEKKKIIP